MSYHSNFQNWTSNRVISSRKLGRNNAERLMLPIEVSNAYFYIYIYNTICLTFLTFVKDLRWHNYSEYIENE